jgi:hypothetical protein
MIFCKLHCLLFSSTTFAELHQLLLFISLLLKIEADATRNYKNRGFAQRSLRIYTDVGATNLEIHKSACDEFCNSRS